MIAKPVSLFALLAAGLFVLPPGARAQGSLTPPGAPAPSMKTLGQIEPRTPIESLPFKITREGSYYVAANLTVPAGTNGISIEASGVTLDLGGFTLHGATGSKEGVLVSPGLLNITIRNGSIAATGAGIEASGASRVRVESINALGTLGFGINVGPDSFVDRSTAIQNENSGIKTGARGQVSFCQSNDNLGHGIDVGQGSTLLQCAANRNPGTGVVAGIHARIEGVSAQENGGAGIETGHSANVTHCSAGQNQGSGIKVGNYSLVEHASAAFNHGAGIQAGTSTSVLDSNASANAWIGITTDLGAQIANSKAESNAGGGISVGEGSTVRDCTASRNTNDGIRVTSECTVVRNNCNNNINLKSASGVHATGTDNVIQENNLLSNDRGLALDVEGNLATKNTATNNSLNYYVIGEQTMGAIVTTLNDPLQPVSPLSNFAF